MNKKRLKITPTHTFSAKTLQELAQFQNFVLRFYRYHGRHELPWRQTDDPFAILISELMLQQTQVIRVIPKYLAFLQRFPTIQQLATAQLSEVLTYWQGLGYNRRAKYLWQLAQKLKDEKNFPKTQLELESLPGIGSYTASAIMAFAYNQPVLVIETNIRAVFLYHFFPKKEAVHDSELLPLLQQTLPQKNPREWYWALMDYGAILKKTVPNPSRKSKQHTKQSKFAGSLRQVRGEIIRLLTRFDKLSILELETNITGNKIHFPQALEQLLAEELVVKEKNMVRLG